VRRKSLPRKLEMKNLLPVLEVIVNFPTPALKEGPNHPLSLTIVVFTTFLGFPAAQFLEAFLLRCPQLFYQGQGWIGSNLTCLEMQRSVSAPVQEPFSSSDLFLPSLSLSGTGLCGEE
jgi:hypothetical protein